MQFEFGSGVLVGLKIVSSGVVTPRRFGVVQGVTVDFNATVKTLMGETQFPLAVARGAAKITGKVQYGNFNAAMFNDIYFNGTLTSGQTLIGSDEPHTPSSNTTTVNNTTGVIDLGVRSAVNGKPFEKVASGPAAGQYSVNTGTGVYTFAAGDANAAAVLITYSYTASGGQTLALTNQLLGVAPQWTAYFKQEYGGKQLTMKLNACMSGKLTFGTKIEDFNIPDMDFEAFDDGTGSLGQMSMSE